MPLGNIFKRNTRKNGKKNDSSINTASNANDGAKSNCEAMSQNEGNSQTDAITKPVTANENVSVSNESVRPENCKSADAIRGENGDSSEQGPEDSLFGETSSTTLCLDSVNVPDHNLPRDGNNKTSRTKDNANTSEIDSSVNEIPSACESTSHNDSTGPESSNFTAVQSEEVHDLERVAENDDNSNDVDESLDIQTSKANSNLGEDRESSEAHVDDSALQDDHSQLSSAEELLPPEPVAEKLVVGSDVCLHGKTELKMELASDRKDEKDFKPNHEDTSILPKDNQETKEPVSSAGPSINSVDLSSTKEENVQGKETNEIQRNDVGQSSTEQTEKLPPFEREHVIQKGLTKKWEESSEYPETEKSTVGCEHAVSNNTIEVQPILCQDKPSESTSLSSLQDAKELPLILAEGVKLDNYIECTEPSQEVLDDELNDSISTIAKLSSSLEDKEAPFEHLEEAFSEEVLAVMEHLIERVERSLRTSESEDGNKEIESFEEPLSTGDSNSPFEDFGDGIPQQNVPLKTDIQSWKVGYLRVKLPSKSRKGKLKAWQKRWVVIQADEFTSDHKNSSLVLSIYHSESGNSRKHSAVFWKSISAKLAVVYRSMSKTHPYAFSIAEDNEPIVHLSAENESASQEWMSAIRAILWPPNSVMQLEKVLNGNEFEISLVDNDFSYRAGLLGTYGYLTVTSKKLILCHPQLGHVIQEWYLNTVDKFQILPQSKEEDVNKVLLMHTSSDSSTGSGEIKIFCNEAVDFLKSVASTIHKVLQYHSKGRSECYRKELAELADWLTPQPSPVTTRTPDTEDYYKVPPRQVRSLLDIPNFIFDLPTKTVIVGEAISMDSLSIGNSPAPKLKPSTTCVSTFSQDSGISMTVPSDDMLNCSVTSFSIGNRSIKGHERSSSESSDGYTPPPSPKIENRHSVREQTTTEA